MKASMKEAGRVFTTGRMVKDYAETYYTPALRGEMGGDDPPVFDEPDFQDGVRDGELVESGRER